MDQSSGSGHRVRGIHADRAQQTRYTHPMTVQCWASVARWHSTVPALGQCIVRGWQNQLDLPGKTHYQRPADTITAAAYKIHHPLSLYCEVNTIKHLVYLYVLPHTTSVIIIEICELCGDSE